MLLALAVVAAAFLLLLKQVSCAVVKSTRLLLGHCRHCLIESSAMDVISQSSEHTTPAPGHLSANLLAACGQQSFATFDQLFNSMYVQQDPLGGTKRATTRRVGGAKRTTTRREEALTGPGLLGAASDSMRGTGQRGVPQEGFLYSPGIGQVPQMDAPASLPHLPGIADDLSYSGDLGPSIAPSWLPELPEVPADSFVDVPPPLPEGDATDLPPLDTTSEPVVECPPPQEADEVPEVQSEEAVPSQHAATALESSSRSSNAEPHAELSLPVTEDGSARASLLESIRQAGGKAGLKSVRGPQQQRKFFSSYKYHPASDPEPAQELLDSLPAVPLQPTYCRVRSQHLASNQRLLKEKLHFNVRPPAKANSTAMKPVWQDEEGLGRLPESTESIGSFLLFNTGENPYVQQDPLGGAKRTTTRREEALTGPGLLGAASDSQSGTGQRGVPQEGFLYSPGMGQVPQMDAPASLPHLPGIADDLSYSGDLGPSIAPSWLPELPEVPADSFVDVPPALPEGDATDLPPLDTTSEPVVECPPPLEADEVPEVQSEEAVPSQHAATALESSSRSSNAEPRAELSLPVTVCDGTARANLLESIRQAGGKAGLKSVHRPQQQRKQVAQPSIHRRKFHDTHPQQFFSKRARRQLPGTLCFGVRPEAVATALPHAGAPCESSRCPKSAISRRTGWHGLPGRQRSAEL
nr:WASH complex subunit 1-like [Dermacentor andersoni]